MRQKDRIINTHIKTIQQEIIDNHGVEVSLEHIEEVIDSQLMMIPIGMANREVIKLDYIGKFRIKPGREAALLANQNKEE